jgi:hypothetical protein
VLFKNNPGIHYIAGMVQVLLWAYSTGIHNGTFRSFA